MNENKAMKENEMARVFSALDVLDKRIEELFQTCHYFVNENKYAVPPATMKVAEEHNQRSIFVDQIEKALNMINGFSDKVDRLTHSIEK